MKNRSLTILFVLFGLVMLTNADIVDSLKEGCIIYTDTVAEIHRPIPSANTDLVTIIADGYVTGRLTQTFVNPLPNHIEATYVFPMPENGAIHGMCVITKDEVIWGKIKEKEQAQAIYDSALAAGVQASLLIQNRPNIFTQKIAHIAPQETIRVVLTYSAMLRYRANEFEMSFPTTIGPRFNPPASSGMGQVENPSYIPPTVRTRASLSVKVFFAPGFRASGINSPTHQISISPALQHSDQLVSLGVLKQDHLSTIGNAKWISLTGTADLPNKDFVLRFKRQSREMDLSLCTYKHPALGDTGYFALTMFPDLDRNTDTLPPVELVIVVDRSGSQRGQPMQKAREIGQALIQKLNPGDLFNVISFNNYVDKCFPSSVTLSQSNRSTAVNYMAGLTASGGTMLHRAVDSCLTPPKNLEYQKVVAFITDGKIGHDQDVLRMLRDRVGSIVLFTFGTGSSVNRYLIEEMGKIGNGQSYIVTLSENVQAVVNDFWDAIESPQLSNIALDFGSAQVFDICWNAPRLLYKGQPLVVLGKYRGSANTDIELTGKMEGSPYTYRSPATFARFSPLHRSLPKIWAREKVSQMELDTANRQAVLQLGLDYSIMTEYTAFVAVSKDVENEEGQYTQVRIAALWPDGVDPFLGGSPVASPLPDEPAEDLLGGVFGTGTEIDGDGRRVEPANLRATMLSAYPNPFNPRVCIRLMLPQNAGKNVAIEIFDIHGRLVKRLFKGVLSGQSMRVMWNGTNRASKTVPSGMYMIRVTIGKQVYHKAITFAK